MAKRGPEDTRTAGQRRADALTELTTLGLASGQLPEQGGDRPRLTFLVRVTPTTTGDHDAGGHDAGDHDAGDHDRGHHDAGDHDRGDHDGGDHDPAAGDGEPAGGGLAPGGVGCRAGLAGRCDPGGSGGAPARGDLSGLLSDIAGAVTGTGPGGALAGSQQPGTAGCGCPQPAGPAGGPAAGMTVEFGVTAFGHGHTALIGTDALFPVATIARICCDADLAVAAVNEYGEPLNLGRTSRNTNRAQRRALALRDQGCVFPGCDWPPARCQAHHLLYWSHDGPTDLDNLALICWFHHQLLHEGGWALARIPPQPQRPGHRPEPPGWLATSPDGHHLRQHRRPAA
jgi:hypothetical protein